MIEEFHEVLRSPDHASTSRLLSHTQEYIINSFEEMFPPSFDMSLLHQIYEEVLGENYVTDNQQIPISLDNQILLNHKLILYFVEVIKNNFVHQDVYTALEQQTQKAQATIRSHIKVEQEMKMYLEYLESKLERSHKELQMKSDHKDLRRQIQILTNKEAALLKEKISLIKANEHLRNQISNLINSKTISPIKSHKQLLHPDKDAREAKSKMGSDLLIQSQQKKQSDNTRQKQIGIRERDQSWHQDLTAKKKLIYFN